MMTGQTSIQATLWLAAAYMWTRTASQSAQPFLPPDCSTVNCPPPLVTAVVGSAYPLVVNNDTVDGSFGITSKIFLDQLTPNGRFVTSLEVPNISRNGVPPTKDQMVTSFSSKSEIALNLSTDGSLLTFMGYLAPIGAIDVSNSNTPGEIDPTNPVGEIRLPCRGGRGSARKISVHEN
jgi:hypothetical protein